MRWSHDVQNTSAGCAARARHRPSCVTSITAARQAARRGAAAHSLCLVCQLAPRAHFTRRRACRTHGPCTHQYCCAGGSRPATGGRRRAHECTACASHQVRRHHARTARCPDRQAGLPGAGPNSFRELHQRTPNAGCSVTLRSRRTQQLQRRASAVLAIRVAAMPSGLRHIRGGCT